MTTISSLTTDQLRRVLAIKEQIERLNSELALIAGGAELPSPTKAKSGGMSAGGKARIAAAQRARWAKMKGNASAKATKKKDGRSSPEARAKIAAAARARWAKVRAAGKTTL